jgi:hypothetical protein
MSITISGLTKRQVKLLDKMWAIDSYQEYMDWKESMTQKQVQEVDTLEEMVMLAELDEVDDLTEANNILTKVMAL